MRHKQRPIKATRHKSVTFITHNNNQSTSFGDKSGLESSNLQQQQLQHHHHHHHHQHQQQQQLIPTISAHTFNDPLMRKQFEHNLRHIGDAFLENNDISIDDCYVDDDDSLMIQDYGFLTNRTTSDHHVGVNTNTSATTTTTSPKKKAPRNDVDADYIEDESLVQNYDLDGFLCDEPGCGKSFPSLRKLRHHKVVHSDDFPFVCEFEGCGKKFKRKFGIDLHSTTHFDLDPEMYSKTSNNSSLPFFGRRMQYSMCKPCGQKFKTVHEYQYHMLKHGKEPFKCPVKGCGQTFSIWKSFQKHRASHYFNYYCKMDSRCDHHTSNLQLLKLHIYCCHFRRKLPKNATLSSRDTLEDEAQVKVETSNDNLEETTEQPSDTYQKLDDESICMDGSLNTEETPEKHLAQEVTTPRRDSRLRKNPPRSSTLGQKNYASINNGSNFAKAIPTALPSKRTRSVVKQQNSRSSFESPPEKKPKMPLKVLPKRSAQRLPMSLIVDDGSTEDDEMRSSEADSPHRERGDDEEDMDGESTRKDRFKCHLCDYKFSVRFQLTKHLSTHLELTPEMYSATADKQVVQLSERRRREFYCDKCNVFFNSMADLDNHMRKHGQRPYVCNFCQAPSSFRLAKQYLSHLYEHRFNYKCTMDPGCDFTINRKDALKLHIFRMHLNQQLPSYIENFASMIDCTEWSEG